MKTEFSFGKWNRESGTFWGRDITRTEDGGFRISQQKKVDGLEEITILKGVVDHEMAGPRLIQELRSRIGQGLYVARESRPDMACAVSMLAQTLPSPTIQDIKEANKCIRQWKQRSDRYLEITGFPDDEMIFLASTDSAWANCRSGHSHAEQSTSLGQPCVTWRLELSASCEAKKGLPFNARCRVDGHDQVYG